MIVWRTHIKKIKQKLKIMKKLLLMLVIVLATTFAKAQPSVFRTNSVVIGTYNKKLKKGKIDFVLQFVGLNLIVW